MDPLHPLTTPLVKQQFTTQETHITFQALLSFIHKEFTHSNERGFSHTHTHTHTPHTPHVDC